MDENLYRCLKQMQASFQGAIFAIPHKDSPAYKALNLPYGEEWKLGQLIDALSWVEEKTCQAATSVYMSNKQ